MSFVRQRKCHEDEIPRMEGRVDHGKNGSAEPYRREWPELRNVSDVWVVDNVKCGWRNRKESVLAIRASGAIVGRTTFWRAGNDLLVCRGTTFRSPENDTNGSPNRRKIP